MKLIQVLLIVGFFPTLWLALSLRRLRSGRLFLRIGLVTLIVCYFLSLMLPQQLNDIALLLGIGRGADLILYGLAVAFIIFVFAVLSKVNQLEKRITILVREVAIMNFQVEELKK
jgi:hypothetical protein